MAIHFSRLFYKNFLSTGNAGTAIQLDRNPTTLVQGASGAGKSTMIDALCFGLYGKPFRSIPKNGLVNSVNGKQCEVWIDFTTNGKQYRVVRGIKPTKFEIYCNGVLVNQDAALRDYQQVLESQILMMTFKTFTQIVILGSTAYTPFMQLSTGARREVIEDILDISIFSTMSQMLKARIQENKDQRAMVDAEIKAKKERAEGIQRLISVLSEKRAEEETGIRVELTELEEEIKGIEAAIEMLVAENDALTAKLAKHQQLVDASNKILSDVSAREASMGIVSKQVAFFNDNDECPTCSQHISSEHKQTMVNALSAQIGEAKKTIDDYKVMRQRIKEKLDSNAAVLSQVGQNNVQLASLQAKSAALQNRQLSCINRLRAMGGTDSDVDTPRNELRQVAKEAAALVERRKELSEQAQMQEHASMLLRDTGIKTAIIKEYLPLINRYLNKYLSDMQMGVEFMLDENFVETVKSRYRDDFAYGNFSEGERLRLDLAIILTWRKIAELKNSTSCNLLILDEILVGRLDEQNINSVLGLIQDLAAHGANIFAIAHGDTVSDAFRGLIRFEKQGNFSVII